MDDWGLNIKRARERKNMTQQDLADSLGVAIRTVRRIEKSENAPDIFLAIRISEVLGTSLEKLFYAK